jgi:GT2 family glycosyltransferase
MTTTVIIATYNRAALLDQCLSHLAQQRFEPGDEVVTVDNGSTDETAAVLRKYQRTFTVPLHILEESRAGKSHALARALTIAAGDILAFTDDDVNVGPGWLDAIRSAMQQDDVALVGGPVAPRWERSAPWWLALNGDEYGRLASPLALVNYGSQPCDLGPRTLLGANLAVRRSVLEQVGGFATHLGKLRGTLLSGEDHEFCRRVQAAGFRGRYIPEAGVYHWVPSSRMRMRYFLSWFFWSGITNAALDDDAQRRERTFCGLPRYLLRRLAAAVVGLPAAALAGNRARALDRAADAAFAVGYAAKSWRLAGPKSAHHAARAGDVA